MKLVFWSPTPFSGRKSSHLLLLALQAAKEGGEQLVLHADVNGSGPEHFLLSGKNRNRMMEQGEFGIELLEKRLRCERYGKETVITSAYSFGEGKLHILPSGGRFFYRSRETAAAEAVVGMMRRAEADFEHVWVEAPAGGSEFSKRILEAADLVVINFSQSPVEVLRALEAPFYQREFFLIGAYEKRSIYTKHNLMLLHPRLQGKCSVIPYDIRFLAACCEGETEAFWERGSYPGKEEFLHPFFHEIRKTYLGLKRCLTKQDDREKKEEVCNTETV